MSWSFKRLLYLILLLFVTYLYYMGFGIFKNDLLPKWNIYHGIYILNDIRIDFFGALIPLLISLILIAVLISVYNFPLKKYFISLVLMLAISLAWSKPTPDAVIISYQLPTIFIGITSSILGLYEESLVKILHRDTFRHFKFNFRNYSKAILIGYSLGSLAGLLIDLILLPVFSFSMYIGGAGLEDGLFLMGLNAIFITLLFSSFMNVFFSKKCWKKHTIRRGIKGDLSITFVAGDKTPSYILLCNGKQVGAMDGNLGLIVFFEIFKPYRGVKHSEIFLRLLEKEAKDHGVTRIEMATPTIEPKFIAALRRVGFNVVKEEPDGNQWFAKDLKP